MNPLLQRHQLVIQQLRKNERSIDVKDLFDDIVLFLNHTTQNQTEGLHVLSVICYELATVYTLEFFLRSDIITHPFFVLLQNTFRMLLTKLTFTSLTKHDEQCLDGISLLIRNLCLNKNKISNNFYIDNNEQWNPDNQIKFHLISYEEIFFTKLFIDKFIRLVQDDIAVYDYEPYHMKYKIVDRLFRLCVKLNDIDHELLFYSVIKCLKSKIYLKLYKTLELRQPVLSPKQSFFIYQCPKFVRLYSRKQSVKVIEELSQSMIEFSSDIFDKQLPVACRGHAKIQAIAWYIELLNHFSLTPSTRPFFKTRIQSGKTIIDQMLQILKTEALITSVQENTELFHADVALMSYSITLLYNLTFEMTIFEELKHRNTISICEKLYEAEDKTIQFASRTLAAILDQDHIDEIKSPSIMARSYLYFIENTIDDVTLTYHGIKLDGVLSNLETIVQNDDVKEEITNDGDGIPLLSRCACEPYLDYQTIQCPALRIIDALSFVNDSAIDQIKENDTFMDHIRDLCRHSSDSHQVPTVQRILWKTEKESEFISQQQSEKKENPEIKKKKIFNEKEALYQYVQGDYRINLVHEKFDVMISYCQDDKETCVKIYDQLKASNLGHVLFDEKNVHELYPEMMANAIENSSVIILCFSMKYRKSYACRLEAEYADKRQRPIIPVKIDSRYDPTGWLIPLIGKREWIDFTKLPFHIACGHLIDQIRKSI